MSLTRHATLTLRHYGAKQFDPAKFKPIADREFVKPHGGLWTSPLDSAYGWKDWCRAEDFSGANLSLCFDLQFSGNLLVIDKLDDLKKLPWVRPFKSIHWPLFQPLRLMGVDAIHLTVNGERATRLTHPYSLYGWDCETVLVMNPKTIAPIRPP